MADRKRYWPKPDEQRGLSVWGQPSDTNFIVGRNGALEYPGTNPNSGARHGRSTPRTGAGAERISQHGR